MFNFIISEWAYLLKNIGNAKCFMNGFGEMTRLRFRKWGNATAFILRIKKKYFRSELRSSANSVPLSSSSRR